MTATAYPQVGTRGTGRHKEAIAQIRLIPGKGDVIVNGRSLESYMGNYNILHIIPKQPLVAAGVEERFTVLIRVHGGGIVGQAIAARMGLARALSALNVEYEAIMRKEGFLTRDSRVKESKKYGRKKARKRFQFSKR
ncbi:MAG: 30S ribosomal protein S9 [Cyanobacteria bacterium P01_H01_bin.74]